MHEIGIFMKKKYGFASERREMRAMLMARKRFFQGTVAKCNGPLQFSNGEEHKTLSGPGAGEIVHRACQGKPVFLQMIQCL